MRWASSSLLLLEDLSSLMTVSSSASASLSFSFRCTSAALISSVSLDSCSTSVKAFSNCSSIDFLSDSSLSGVGGATRGYTYRCFVSAGSSSVLQHISWHLRTLPNVYSPYPTPPTTVAMMNQSLQSLLGTSGGGCCQPYGGYPP